MAQLAMHTGRCGCLVSPGPHALALAGSQQSKRSVLRDLTLPHATAPIILGLVEDSVGQATFAASSAPTGDAAAVTNTLILVVATFVLGAFGLSQQGKEGTDVPAPDNASSAFLALQKDPSVEAAAAAAAAASATAATPLPVAARSPAAPTNSTSQREQQRQQESVDEIGERIARVDEADAWISNWRQMTFMKNSRTGQQVAAAALVARSGLSDAAGVVAAKPPVDTAAAEVAQKAAREAHPLDTPSAGNARLQAGGQQSSGSGGGGTWNPFVLLWRLLVGIWNALFGGSGGSAKTA